MRSLARSPFVAALLGGAVVAVVMTALDVGGGRRTTRTIVQQAPMAAVSRPADGTAGHG